MLNNIGERLRSCSLMARQLPVPYFSHPAFQFENFRSALRASGSGFGGDGHLLG